MNSSDRADHEGTEATASGTDRSAPDATVTNTAVVDEAPTESEKNLDEEESRGPIRKTLGVIGTIFWSLIILAGVVFVWPPTWGGPITVTVVQGHSMEPVYYTGDIAIAMRNYSNEYAIGDVIVYKATYGETEGVVIHRIIKELPNGNYITQGDNKEMPDPWEIIPSNIFGKVIFHIPGADTWLSLTRTPIFIGILTGSIVIWVLWPRSDDEDEDPEKNGDGNADKDAGKDDEGVKLASDSPTTTSNENKERGPNP